MRKKVISFFAFLLLFALLLTVIRVEHFGPTGFAILLDDSSSFPNGTFSNTFYNSSGFVQLSAGQTSGTYTSAIFDVGSQSIWNNISWVTQTCYGCELPDNGVTESYYTIPANMSGNVLLAHFNEVSGSTASDSSGNNNDGSCSGFSCPSFGVSGKFSTAADFNPSGSGDYFNFGNDASLNPTNQLTVEAWVRPLGSLSSGPSIIEKNWNNQFALIYTSAGGGNARLRAYLNTGSNDVLTGSSVHSTGNWYHVVFTYDGSQMRLYSNGQLDGSQSASGSISTSSNDWLVGAGWNGFSPSYFFDGFIDEVAIYDRALSADEVNSHYLRGILDLNISVRSCDDSSCSGESFQSLNSSNPQGLSLADNQFFQYRATFASESSSATPKLFSSSVDYTLDNSAPQIIILSPQNITYSSDQLSLNYSVFDSDGNLDSCWYSVDGGVSNVSLVCGENVSLTASQGSNSWFVFANDSDGFESFSSVSFFVDSVVPLISFSSGTQENGSLISSSSIGVNVSVSDDNLFLVTSRLFNSLGQQVGVNTSNSSFFTSFSVPSDGFYYFNSSASDVAGNSNSTLTYQVEVDFSAPLISVLEPSDGSVIGTTDDIVLDFSVSDSNLDSCWFMINGANLTYLPGCSNTTFSVPSNGVYNLTVFANDSLGSVGSDSSEFTVSAGAPGIFLSSPADNLFTSQNTIYFNFTASDAFLDTCSLVGDFNGLFVINQSNSSLVSNQPSFFVLVLPEGSYKWAVSCNNTNGFVSTTSNRSFTIDQSVPLINIIDPEGTYNSFVDVPLDFVVTDDSTSQCSFNVTKVGQGLIVSQMVEDCIPRDPINVGDYGSYQFFLTATDAAGNSYTSNTSFNVEFSNNNGNNGGGNPGSSSSSGGGGGGGSSSISIISGGPSVAQVSFGQLPSVKIKTGQAKILELEITNTGTKFLNKCKLIAEGSSQPWIVNEQVQSFAPGQKGDYIFSLNVPVDAEVRTYNTDLRLLCDELNATKLFTFDVFAVDFGFSVISSLIQDNTLSLNYNLADNSGSEQNIVMEYSLFNQQNTRLYSGVAEDFIGPNEVKDSSFVFSLPKNSVGELVLQIDVSNDKEESLSVNHPVSIQSQGLLTGLVALNSQENQRIMSGVFVILLVVVLGYFVMKFLYNQDRKSHAPKQEKRIIELDLGGKSWYHSLDPRRRT